MKRLLFFITLFAFHNTICQAQGKTSRMSDNKKQKSDTVYAITGPAMGMGAFRKHLEASLLKNDTVGKRYRVIIDNIGYMVNEKGLVVLAWPMFHPRPIHNEVIKILEATPWVPAERNGKAVPSYQELLDVQIYLTKSALKRLKHWKSLPERIFSPYRN